MSAKSTKIEALEKLVRRLKRKEDSDPRYLFRRFYALWRWGVMLRHEFVRDDVKIRAESMAFLTVVSLLPLIAGGFFVFTFFSQFGMVQDSIQGFFWKFLGTIPEEHRVFVEDYVIKFKNSYLSSITQKSGTIGIFAIFILIWVGLQMFNNIDRTLNAIWSSEKERPFLEKFRNFIMVTVLAPIVLAATLSIPLVINKLATTSQFLGRLTALNILLNNFLVPLVILGTFALLYKFIPVTKVRWKSALSGALFSTFFFELSNVVMQVYFRYGTNSAYGKLAIMPLVAFWIYLVWIIIISGAEISFLVQNSHDILFEAEHDASVKNAKAILLVLARLFVAFRDGLGPREFLELQKVGALPAGKLHALMEYLMAHGYIVECETERLESGAFVLARDLSGESVSALLAEYLNLDELSGASSSFDKKWHQALRAWCQTFDSLTIADLVPVKKVAK